MRSQMTVVSNDCGLKWTWSQVSNDCGLKWMVSNDCTPDNQLVEEFMNKPGFRRFNSNSSMILLRAASLSNAAGFSGFWGLSTFSAIGSSSSVYAKYSLRKRFFEGHWAFFAKPDKASKAVLIIFPSFFVFPK